MTTNNHHPATDPTDEHPRCGAYVAADGSVVVYDDTADAAWIQSDAAVSVAEMT